MIEKKSLNEWIEALHDAEHEGHNPEFRKQVLVRVDRNMLDLKALMLLLKATIDNHDEEIDDAFFEIFPELSQSSEEKLEFQNKNSKQTSQDIGHGDSNLRQSVSSVPDLKLKDAKIVMKDGQLSVIEAIESSVPDFIDCLECNGSGVWVNDEYGNSYKFPVKCRDCNGSGKVKK